MNKGVYQTTLIENFERTEFLKWLIGFIEGEGCFTFQYNTTTTQKNHQKRGYWIHALFQIGLSITDKDIIYKIKDVLRMGCIYQIKHKSYTGTISNTIYLRIAKIEDLLKLINILDRYRFYTKKGNDYHLWKIGVEIIRKKEHLTKEGLEKLLSVWKLMNIRLNKKSRFNNDKK